MSWPRSETRFRFLPHVEWRVDYEPRLQTRTVAMDMADQLVAERECEEQLAAARRLAVAEQITDPSE